MAYKTIIIGLGSWAGRQQWPLDWLQAADTVKVLGFVLSPIYSQTVQLSWDRVLASMEHTLRLWGSRRLDTLAQRVQVLESLIMTKAWYFAHLLPLATEAAGPSPPPGADHEVPPAGRGFPLAGEATEACL